MGGPRLWAVLCVLLACTEAYRLNVPRVLLPYHPSNQVTFLLEVTHPEGGCFHWWVMKFGGRFEV